MNGCGVGNEIGRARLCAEGGAKFGFSRYKNDKKCTFIREDGSRVLFADLRDCSPSVKYAPRGEGAQKFDSRIMSGIHREVFNGRSSSVELVLVYAYETILSLWRLVHSVRGNYTKITYTVLYIFKL